MNEHHPYDKFLADKLKKLPLPDIEKSWPEMRKLLDDEMPEGGGYSKRRGGWWFFGAVLVFIIAGSWTLMTLHFSRQNVDPPLTNSQNSSPPEADQAKKDVRKNSEKEGEADDKILLSTDQKIVNESKNQTPLTEKQLTEKNLAEQSSETTASSAPAPGHPDNTLTAAKDSRKGAGKSAGNGAGKSAVKSAGNSAGMSAGMSAGNGSGYVRQANVLRASQKNRTKTDPSEKYLQDVADIGAPLNPGLLPGDPIDERSLDPSVIAGVQHFPAASFAALMDSVNDDHLSNVQYAHVSRKYYRRNKKYGVPANIRQPYTTAGRNFAIGLSLPLGFPLGDQKMLGYNVNAGPNTATDYIPAPHIQYHFNGRSYIQSEVQVMNPQFIRPVLLYKNYSANSVSNTTSSIYARKLYYFNVPVSVHYSPFKHFYMGTGLQFSSLLSGVAMHEKIRTGMVSSDSIYQVSYAKFSNDSISNKLNGTEMRLMFDANYYWNKFTVGLRYNQALSNYVSIRAAPSSPYTFDKNKALQFYMRYNLWEDKKRKNTGKRLLTLK